MPAVHVSASDRYNEGEYISSRDDAYTGSNSRNNGRIVNGHSTTDRASPGNERRYKDQSRNFSCSNSREKARFSSYHNVREEAHGSSYPNSKEEAYSSYSNSRDESSYKAAKSQPKSKSAPQTAWRTSSPTRPKIGILHTTLHILPTATDGEIGRAPKLHRIAIHPDKLKKSGMSLTEKWKTDEQAKDVAHAAEILGDAQSREKYDRSVAKG